MTLPTQAPPLRDAWLRRLFLRAMGCTPATMLGTVAIFTISCSAAVAQELGGGAPPIAVNGDMTLLQALDLVLKLGWPAVATFLGHRGLKLLENGAKATEAGRPMLRLDVTHRHVVEDSRVRAHRRSSDRDIHVHHRHESDDRDDRPSRRNDDERTEETYPAPTDP